MKWPFIWLIRFYQRVLSPLKLRPTCRFSPTCSAYALEAFSRRGAIVGLILTVGRIIRCNPFCAGGYDPVPESGLGWKRKRKADTNENDPYEHKLICQDYMMRRDRRSENDTEQDR
ncbi:MAG: membrane protein insertion efficiency factor YidD [Clostridia bacterium]|nr:membrane protein insertion efficiency factor YidD [Clostridia bacterium]